MEQQFCLRWNNHQNTLISVLDSLLSNERLIDVTLTAEGQMIGAHKVVLSACSPYFEQIFSRCGDKHPVIFLKDVRYDDLKSLLDYMYRGEVNVSQDQLPVLIKTAESLKIKGLADGGSGSGERKKSSMPDNTPAPTHTGAEKPNVNNGVESREGSISPVPKRVKRTVSKVFEAIPSVEMEHNDSPGPVAPLSAASTPLLPQTSTPLIPARSLAPQSTSQTINNVASSADIDSDDIDQKLESEETVQNSNQKLEANVKEEILDDDVLDLDPDNDDGEIGYTTHIHNSEGEGSGYVGWPSSAETSQDSNHFQNSQDGNQGNWYLGCHFLAEPLNDSSDGKSGQNAAVTWYSCDRCGRRYTQKPNLKRHQRLECGVERKFQCKQCGLKFVHKHHLKSHMTSVCGTRNQILAGISLNKM